MTEHFLSVTRTARYVVLGDETVAPDEIWFVLHGYGQLAARFARAFAPLAERGGARRRLVVAPEALSRFYVDVPAAASHVAAKVGATWMTREDREHEIADYVAYLDALAERVLAGAAGPPPALHVLGFSQGVATAARWVARGRVRADRLTLWGGTLPDDLGREGDGAAGAGAAAWAERLRALPAGVTLVGGAADALVPPAALGMQEQRLRALGVACRVVTFQGGHEIHAPTLAALADGVPDLERGRSGRGD